MIGFASKYLCFRKIEFEDTKITKQLKINFFFRCRIIFKVLIIRLKL